MNLKNYLGKKIVALSLAGTIGLAAFSHAEMAVDERYIWDLTELYPTPEAWEAKRQEVLKETEALKKLKGKLGKNAKSLASVSDQISDVYKEAARLAVYATLKADEDTRIAENEERRQLARALFSDISAAVSWYEPEVLELGANKVNKYIKKESGLVDHVQNLEDILRAAPHTLTEEQEAILAKAGKVTSGPGSIYGVLANANLPWEDVILADGEKATLSQSGYGKHRQATNRDDRKLVFDTFWGTWKDYEATMGTILNSHVQGLVFNTDVRNYDSSVERSFFDDNLPKAVYTTLVEEANKGLPTLHRYFELRKRMLGIEDDLRYYDIYPPLVSLDKKFTIEDSIELTRKALAPMGEEYLAAYDAGVQGGWMHVFPAEGKRSGAYMYGAAYDVHPYVFLNHNDDFQSASTFAHEYGHAVHSIFSNEAQPWETAGYSIFIAETAAIVNEVLLEDLMIKEAKTPEEKLYYLGSALESLRGTYFRQTMFAEFELKINEEVEQGNILTGGKLSSIYLELLKKYHGHDAGVMQIDDLFGIEWAYIPHFYYDFYVFQYSTSIAASAIFAEKIASGDTEARDAFITMLKAGGSDHPYELMKTAGLDMAKPDAYRALVSRMDDIMDEMEKILDEM